jgi:hypothetical protein
LQGKPCLGRAVLDHAAALHQHADAGFGRGQHVQRSRRVTVDDQQVGQCTGLEHADVVLLPHQAGRRPGRALQQFEVRHRRRAQGELAVLPPVHVAQQVGAEDHRHAFGTRDAYRLQAAFGHLSQLVQHRRRPAQAGALLGQRRIGGQRRHEEGAVRLHQPRGGLVDQVAVLDAAHAGLHRAGHRAR